MSRETSLAVSPAAALIPHLDTIPLDCWIAGVFVRVEGLPLSMRGRLARLMGPLAAPPDSLQVEPAMQVRVSRRGRGDWLAQAGDDEPDAFQSIFRLLTHVEWRAVSGALRATSDIAPVHGATLARGEATVLLIAPSGHGKTTLTLGLMERGWKPMSDDVSLMDATTLRARVFPRCFHIDSATRIRLLERSDLDWPGTLALYVRPAHWAEDERRPTTVVLVQRDFLGTSASSLSPITQAEAAGAILGATLRNQLSGSELARVAVRLAAQARRCYRLNNGVLEEALDLIEVASAE